VLQELFPDVISSVSTAKRWVRKRRVYVDGLRVNTTAPIAARQLVQVRACTGLLQLSEGCVPRQGAQVERSRSSCPKLNRLLTTMLVLLHVDRRHAAAQVFARDPSKPNKPLTTVRVLQDNDVIAVLHALHKKCQRLQVVARKPSKPNTLLATVRVLPGGDAVATLHSQIYRVLYAGVRQQA
jgi:hypothetical protein